MEGFEKKLSVPEKNQNGDVETSEISSIDNSLVGYEGDREHIHDVLFNRYMKQKLLEDFFEDLDEYLDPEDVDNMRAVLSEHSDSEVYATLSLPSELRNNRFQKFAEAVEDGKSPKNIMEEFIQMSSKYGFGIGYHTSPNEIIPSEDGSWIVKGLEQDHRDGDASKAYYSTKYRHLFKKKSPKYIYIVRTEPETHRTDGNWSRAGNLSIVSKVPFNDVVSFVRETAKGMEDEKRKGQQV